MDLFKKVFEAQLIILDQRMVANIHYLFDAIPLPCILTQIKAKAYRFYSHYHQISNNSRKALIP
jgi:hypothetical protein